MLCHSYVLHEDVCYFLSASEENLILFPVQEKSGDVYDQAIYI